LSSASGEDRFGRLDGRAGVVDVVADVSYCWAGDASIARCGQTRAGRQIVEGCDDLADSTARHGFK